MIVPYDPEIIRAAALRLGADSVPALGNRVVDDGEILLQRRGNGRVQCRPFAFGDALEAGNRLLIMLFRHLQLGLDGGRIGLVRAGVD
jgi:hypothetical protein